MNTRNHRSRTAFAIAFLAVFAVAVTSCIKGDEPYIVDPIGGELFDRYVSLGNSLTAGFQSGGINVNTQREAYPVLLAEKANAPFGVPALALPGCPPLLVGPLTTTRTDTTACGLRVFDAPSLVQNLAVPGANTGHLSNPVGTGNTLNTLILGGRTQIAAMKDAEPTLISVWVGNNDALGAALAGDTAGLTPLTTFQTEYDEIVAAMLETDAQDAILMGVVNPMVAAPALQPGAYFWALPDTMPLSATDTLFFDVSDNCAPSVFGGLGDDRLISFIGVGNAIAAGEDPLHIDCVDGVQIGGAYEPDYLIDEAEQIAIAARITAFNSYIAQQADDNGWIYIDPTTTMVMPALADPDKIRKCQDLPTDAASFGAAVQSSCPVDLDPTTDATFFGSYISHDGIHPTGAFHAATANVLADSLNAVHGLSLPIN
ncbi:MAG: hypothetical protein R6U63_05450 [Longimicrobiales bacterium]